MAECVKSTYTRITGPGFDAARSAYSQRSQITGSAILNPRVGSERPDVGPYGPALTPKDPGSTTTPYEPHTQQVSKQPSAQNLLEVRGWTTGPAMSRPTI